MPGINLHNKPFDESTLAKLEIFEKYAEAWLPVFCHKPGRTICIFDFFAGTGYDKNNVPGSPIRILKVVKEFLEIIFKNTITVKVYLNEYNAAKYDLLKASWETYLDSNRDLRRVIKYEIFNKDFEEVFKTLLPEINKYPSLVFLDQNGVKFAADEYFQALNKLSETDFLFFISSSYIWRFGEKKEFQKYLPININELKKNPYKFIHQEVVHALKRKLPDGSKLKLYPFSIKKGTHIYGLVFGAKHLLAVDKFLDIVWKKNPINGDANFDIYDDLAPVEKQLSLFPKPLKLNKIERFQLLLEEEIKLAGTITNLELYEFTIDKAHICTHTKDHLVALKNKGKITYDSRFPKINYEAVKKKDVVTIKWVAK
ncbi:three-Cys-motif partner protein TcmP [Adhaeribacter swui]|uniref:Three-Cys-motif partner protein TcmP n=1 Tax=Adhaeribacter swui TaxID=2086471 RepID=A0A7G7G4W2_9BACT|nr:three-Cys-motif partner protein TcmP [Adhaeribacter swui]QNF32196.1 three-Cys-motif partner protein TcmP [Adhaeribacter swui]